MSESICLVVLTEGAERVDANTFVNRWGSLSNRSFDLWMVGDNSEDFAQQAAIQSLQLRCFRNLEALSSSWHAIEADWVFFGDARDAMAAERISTLCSAMTTADAAIAFSGVQVCKRGAFEVSDAALAALDTERGIRWPTPEFGLLHRNPAVVSTNLAMRLDAAKRLGPPAALPHCFGWDLLLRASAWGRPLQVDAPLYELHLDRLRDFEFARSSTQVEREVCLARHFQRAAVAPFPNADAAQPWGWQHVFQQQVKAISADGLWSRYAHGQVPGGRTVGRV